ncbi:MAG: signal peptide peptidase SppA [Salibacteraceae bacterium]
MKQFFKYMFASTLGTVLGFIIIILVLGIAVSAAIGSAMMVAQGGEQVEIKENSLLVLDMTKRIVERERPSFLDNLEIEEFEDEKGIALSRVLKGIEDAKEDERIKGILLKGNAFHGSLSAMKDVRDALMDFKSSGKFVLAYDELYTQGAYYVATAADDLYIFKEGMLDLRGLRSEIAFFKNAMDKLGIKATVVRGPDNEYKSAVEPFTRESMSEANRMQLSQLLKRLWEEIGGSIAEARGLTMDELDSIANNLLVKDPEDAYALGLVDGVMYYDEVLRILRSKLSIEEDDDIETIEIDKYTKKALPGKKGEKSWELKDEIALVYAVGSIGSGEGDDETIGSNTLAKAIRDARKDDDIKAIVMRVSSPGGSALASEVIWREVKLAAESKPFIISFGPVAASGGYYISTHADRIFASPNTITGSIGVFGLLPDVRGLVTDKMGITFDNVKTHRHADFGSMTRGFDDAEMALIEHYVNETYQDFIEKVADGRNLDIDYVDSIARGRIWIGTDALEIGLVDEFGDLDDAIKYAASQAGLDDYELKELPKQKDPLEELLKGLSAEARIALAEWALGEDVRWIKSLDEMKEMKGVQMRILYDFPVE